MEVVDACKRQASKAKLMEELNKEHVEVRIHAFACFAVDPYLSRQMNVTSCSNGTTLGLKQAAAPGCKDN